MCDNQLAVSAIEGQRLLGKPPPSPFHWRPAEADTPVIGPEPMSGFIDFFLIQSLVGSWSSGLLLLRGLAYRRKDWGMLNCLSTLLSPTRLHLKCSGWPHEEHGFLWTSEFRQRLLDPVPSDVHPQEQSRLYSLKEKWGADDQWHHDKPTASWGNYRSNYRCEAIYRHFSCNFNLFGKRSSPFILKKQVSHDGPKHNISNTPPYCCLMCKFLCRGETAWHKWERWGRSKCPQRTLRWRGLRAKSKSGSIHRW